MAILGVGLVAYGSAVAADCQRVQAEGEAILADSLSPDEAKTLALSRARTKALETLGITVRTQSTDVMTDSGAEFFTSFSRLVSEGLFVKEEKKWSTRRRAPSKPDEPEIPVYHVKIDACVSLIKKDPAKKIEAEFVTHDNQKAVVPIFREGETALIDASCSFQCRLTVFNILSDGTAVLQLPSGTIPESPALKPGEPWRFPPTELALVLSTGSPDRQKVDEAYLFVATEQPVRPAKNKLSFEELQQWLHSFPIASWVETMLTYRVVRKVAAPK